MVLFRVLSLLVCSGLVSCTNDLEILSVQREGLLIASVEGEETPWKSTEYYVFQGQSIVKEFVDPTPVSILFKRYYFIFEGRTPDNHTFELTIAIDLVDNSDMRHRYSSQYTVEKGGLHQIELILKKEGTPVTYETAILCADSQDDAFFEIKRQTQTERLVTGSFRGVLCVATPSSIINITSAEFKDIAY